METTKDNERTEELSTNSSTLEAADAKAKAEAEAEAKVEAEAEAKVEAEAEAEIKSTIAKADERLKRVVGKSYYSSGTGHDGSIGHKIEKDLGLAPNSRLAPDMDEGAGVEVKSSFGSSRFTFGDWSPSYKLYHHKRPQLNKIPLETFYRAFGSKAPGKNRYSFTLPKDIPTIDCYNQKGLILEVKETKVQITYSYSHDFRKNKDSLVPNSLRSESLILMSWDIFEGKKSLSKKFKKKFGGLFALFKPSKLTGKTKVPVYHKMSFEQFINSIKSGDIFFDCGMHEGNPRPYAQWRCSIDYCKQFQTKEQTSLTD